MKRRVVVTGMGTINPIGNDAKTTLGRMQKTESMELTLSLDLTPVTMM